MNQRHKFETETIKLQKKTQVIKSLNILFDIGLSSIFLDMCSRAKTTKAKINKCDHIKLKSFCTIKKGRNNNQQNKRAAH